MEIELLTVQSAKEPWSEAAHETYSEKINHHVKFKLTRLKSRKLERDDQALKRAEESKALLGAIRDGDTVILLDEQGKSLGSKDLAQEIQKRFDSGHRRIVFVIGGAFGVDETLKKRSNLTISLSKMTMNHMVAAVVVLEQIYRSMMILKGKPYHNE